MSDPHNKVYSWAAAMDRCDELLARAVKAEAERDTLRAALTMIADGADHAPALQHFARAALTQGAGE